MNNTIALCGFMACGKTTVGKRAARESGMDFVDMDKFISEQEGKTINQIFIDDGEPYFRKLEVEAAASLSKLPNTIIATGGGAVMNTAVVEAFRRENVKIIFLNTPFYVIMRRLSGDTTRPLVLQNNKDEIKRLYHKRYRLYVKAADVVINVEEKKTRDLAKMVIDQVKTQTDR